MKILALVITCFPLVAFAGDSDAASSWVAGIVATLAAGAIFAAAKSWSDVNVLKAETARLAKEVSESAQASHVTESLARIEKRLDRFEAMWSPHSTPR